MNAYQLIPDFTNKFLTITNASQYGILTIITFDIQHGLLYISMLFFVNIINRKRVGSAPVSNHVSRPVALYSNLCSIESLHQDLTVTIKRPSVARSDYHYHLAALGR